MIEINPFLKIGDDELSMDFIRATGPGGQNVNKVATSVQLRFDIRNSQSLSAEVKERLIKLAGSRVNQDGILIIEARQYRTQEQNKADAQLRLANLIRQALARPKMRRLTRPTLTSRAARLGSKKKHAELKRFRRYNPEEWE